MSKKMKKTIALILSVIIVVGISITVYAINSTTTYYDVTFAFYQRDTTVTSPANSQVYDDITISVSEGTTYKEALDDVLAEEEGIVGIEFFATWSGTGPFYLDALVLEDKPYVNDYLIIGTTYTGTTWMWDYDLTIDADYPAYYLNQVTVTDDITIYLIFEKSSFSS